MTAAKGKLRVGVAGAGVFGGFHAGKYAARPDADFVCVFDPDALAASRLAQQHGARPTTDFDELLSVVDAVTIAAPARVHAELALRALAAGKHVLVEKPIALSLADADRLIEAADARNLVLQVGHQERFFFDFLGVLRAPEAPVEIHCTRAGPYTGRCMDVSATLDLMIHDLDLARRAASGDLVDVTAQGRRAHGPFADEMRAELTFAGGARAYMFASRMHDARERIMRIVYPSGCLTIDFVNREVNNETPFEFARPFSGDDAAPIEARDPLGAGVSSFINSILTNDPVAIPGDEGRAALALALAIEDAAVVELVSSGEAELESAL